MESKPRRRTEGRLKGPDRPLTIDAIRRLIQTTPQPKPPDDHSDCTNAEAPEPWRRCPRCGGPMHSIETFTRGQTPKSRAPPREDAA
jgi:hypothetical protein